MSDSATVQSVREEGNRAFRAGQYVEAAGLYTEALAADPANAVLYSNRSACYAKLQRWDDALLDAFATIKHKPGFTKGYSRLGDALCGLGRQREALRWYSTGLRQDPTNKFLAQRVEELGRLLPDPMPGEAPVNSETTTPRSNGGVKAETPSTAAETKPEVPAPQDGAAPATPTTPSTPATPFAAPLTQGEPTAPVARLREQAVVAYQQQRYLEAIELFSEALELGGGREQHLLHSGRSAAYCKTGNYHKAIKDAFSAMQLKTGWAEGFARLGDSLCGLGRHEDALGWYERGAQADPADEYLRDAVERMRKRVQPAAARRNTSGYSASSREPCSPARAYGAVPVSPLSPPNSARQAAPASAPLYKPPILEKFRLFTPPEVVTKRWFDWPTGKWLEKQITVCIDTAPFAEGSLRSAFRLLDLSREEGQRACVAKVHRPQHQSGVKVSTSDHYIDVEMQATCQSIALAFNAHSPPKRVQFLEAYIIERGKGAPLAHRVMFVEPYVEGKFTKYNNNDGWVARDDRNTPQAFSHFSFEFSSGRLMVVDIQGVGDVYTDPQVHTFDGDGFGVGNCGPTGIEQFFRTHACNPICEFLGLARHSHATKEGTTTVPPHRRAQKQPGYAANLASRGPQHFHPR